MPADAKEPIGSQPKATAPMAAGGNRNALNVEVGPDGRRDWSFGLFDCISDGLCCYATFCPCVLFSTSRQRLRHLQSQGTPLPGGGDTVTTECCVFAALGIILSCWRLQIGNREGIRTRYSIRGERRNDCLISLCCQLCALVQERREIEAEENSL